MKRREEGVLVTTSLSSLWPPMPWFLQFFLKEE